MHQEYVVPPRVRSSSVRMHTLEMNTLSLFGSAAEGLVVAVYYACHVLFASLSLDSEGYPFVVVCAVRRCCSNSSVDIAAEGV